MWYVINLAQYPEDSSSVQFSRSVVSDSLWLYEPQHTRPPCPSPTPRVHSDSHPSSQWCHPTISSSSSPSPPALNLSQHQGLVKWVSSLHEVAKVLEFQLQHQFFQWTPRTDTHVISISVLVITVSSTTEFFSYTRINSLLVMEVKQSIIIVVLYNNNELVPF